jgi:hypothetical protein
MNRRFDAEARGNPLPEIRAGNHEAFLFGSRGRAVSLFSHRSSSRAVRPFADPNPIPCP